jgi:hypothetical protein
MAHHIPSFHKFFHVHRGVRLVRSFPCQKVLHETVQSLCLDSCRVTHCCGSVLSHYSEHFRRDDMVRTLCAN